MSEIVIGINGNKKYKDLWIATAERFGITVDTNISNHKELMKISSRSTTNFFVVISEDTFIDIPKLIQLFLKYDYNKSLKIVSACPYCKSYIVTKGFKEDNFEEIIDKRIVGCSYTGKYNHVSCCELNGFKYDPENLTAETSPNIAIFGNMNRDAMECYNSYLDYKPIFPKTSKRTDLDWTLVTGYFDLTQQSDDISAARSREHYLKNSRGTLSLDYNMVIFCEQSTENFFMEKRREYGLEKKTKIITMKFDQFKLHKYKDIINKNRIDHPYHFDPRNTASYYLICMARYEMLSRVIETNPFNGEYFSWVNICLQRMGLRNIEGISDVIKERRKKFSTLYIDFVPKELTVNLPEYYKYGRCGQCSGFFTGNKEYMYKFCQAIIKKFIEITEKGYGHADEQLYSLVYFEEPELFDHYFGDYSQMVCNYIEMRENPGTTLNFFIPKAKMANRFDLVYKACKTIVNGLTKNYFKLSEREIIELFNSYFIAAWWTNGYRNECIDIIKQFGEMCDNNIKLSQTLIELYQWFFNTVDFIKILIDKPLIKILEGREPGPMDFGRNQYIIYGNFSINSKSFIGISNPCYRPSFGYQLDH